MLQTPILLAAVGFFPAACLLVALYKALVHLASIPGPFAARFTDLWYAYRMYQGHFEQDNIRLHQKHGAFVRYGPNRVSISSPLAAKVIYGHGTKFIKSSWYETWSNPSPDQWNLFGDRSPERHGMNRRQYQSTYSMSSLLHYEAYVDECANLFCQRLSEMSVRCGWNGAVNMGHWLQCYAFDVIGLITYSKRIGFLDLGDDVGGVMQNLGDHLGYASLVGVYPGLHPILFRVRNWIAGSRGKGRQYIINFTQECMAEHQSQPKAQLLDENADAQPGETVDFLSKFLQKHSENPLAFTRYHALAGCTSNMVAGSDTTSISLSAILYYMLRYPAVMQRLREEVDSHFPQAEKSSNITFHQAQEMPYLQAVIKEALRMHPATGLPLERVVPEGGATIDGVFFPEGTIVGVNCWVEHRNKSIFGDDADTFNPDRWLGDDNERLSMMSRHWMPFGLGSRTCIGRHISMLEISKLIPRLVRDFDMDICDTDPWETVNYWFVKPKNFMVSVRPRADSL